MYFKSYCCSVSIFPAKCSIALTPSNTTGLPGFLPKNPLPISSPNVRFLLKSFNDVKPKSPMPAYLKSVSLGIFKNSRIALISFSALRIPKNGH